MGISVAAVGAAILVWTTFVAAEEATSKPQSVYEQLLVLFPDLGLQAEDISDSPVPGMLQVKVGSQLVYVSEDGRYMFQGDVYDLHNGVRNLRDNVRIDLMASLPEDSMLVYGPDDAAHTVTVFTDIDCPYCRKFHREMADYNERSIRVRYLFFPRSGPDTPSWLKAEGVWCANDRLDAMTRAKQGEEIAKPARCGTTPVEKHYLLGKAAGISGTPAIITESGQLLGGYMAADDLAQGLATDN
ncbi:MAG: DsbC family protein [Gammaproteobacteria bacterium]